jgi:diguanylate cyclase (GGDEF)-like protein/PAS domain S-box-containing protein
MSWVPRTRRARRQARDASGPAVEPGHERGPTHSKPVPELDLDNFEPAPATTDGWGVSGGSGNGNGNGASKGSGAGTGAGNGDGVVFGDVSFPAVERERVVVGTSHPTLPFGATPRMHTSALHDADVVIVLSADGRFVFVSASAERLFGVDVRDAVGQHAFDYFDAESVAGVRALFNDLVARRRLSVALEMRTHRPDGRVLDVELTAANHLEDAVGGIVVTLRDVTTRKVLEQRAGEVDRRQHALIESLADGLLMLDEDGRIVRVNEAFEVMFRAPRTRILGRDYTEVLDRSRRHGVEMFDETGEVMDPGEDPVLTALQRGRRIVGCVVGHRTGDAPAEWVRVNAQPILGAEGRIIGAVASFADITESRRAAYALRQEEEFLRVLLDTLDEGIVACDAQGRLTIFNPAARRLHGLEPDVEPIGRVPSSRMLRHPDGSPIDPEESPLLLAMAGERLHNVEILLAPHDGEQRKVSVNGQALVDEDGWKLGAVVAMHDVTEQKRNEERLADLAHHDPLTGLANRTLLAIRMREAVDSLVGPLDPIDGDPDGVVASGHRSQPEHPGIAVYLLDLDDFKEVNDELGHDVGDDLLVAVAGRLVAIVRPSDTVARLGGDEFVVVCQIESGEEEMLRISQRISAALARPYRIDGRTLVAEASVGGVFVDDPDTDPSRLLSLADDAMYGVKWSRRRQRRSMLD